MASLLRLGGRFSGLRPALSISQQCLMSSAAAPSMAVIGAGKMAEAMIDGLKFKKQLPDEMRVFDLHDNRAQVFHDKFGAVQCDSAAEAVKDAKVVMIAVKPQNVPRVGKALKGKFSEDTVLLSIMAGVTQDMLHNAFGTDKIVRTMPNTPAAVQEGITVWSCTEEVTREEKKMCSTVLEAFGEQVYVSDEKYLDMATAVSGSGPAYVLLMMEAMIETGVHFGFPRDVATKLVLHTVKGSAAYALQSEESMAALKENITSPGGTTASALYTLEKGNLRTTVADGLWAAYRRSLELGRNDPNVGPDRNKY